MHLTMVEGCSLDIMMEVGTPKGVDFAAAGRYDDDVISKQERANDDRNIMYDAGFGKQGKRNAKQSKGPGLTFSIAGRRNTKCRRRCNVRIFALVALLKKRAHKILKCLKIKFSTF